MFSTGSAELFTVQVIGRPESLMTDLLPPDSAESFKELNHWTTLPRRDGADQGHNFRRQTWNEDMLSLVFRVGLGTTQNVDESSKETQRIWLMCADDYHEAS